jgi:hypothetical protein
MERKRQKSKDPNLLYEYMNVKDFLGALGLPGDCAWMRHLTEDMVRYITQVASELPLALNLLFLHYTENDIPFPRVTALFVNRLARSLWHDGDIEAIGGNGTFLFFLLVFFLVMSLPLSINLLLPACIP